MTQSDTAPETRLVVLSSSSPFRRGLLKRLGILFSTDLPNIDEQERQGESPESLVVRLAIEKAQAVGQRHLNSLIIGSDQVACIDGQILGKPGNRAKAISQLQQASGRRVSFFTGLCLLNAATGQQQVVCEPFYVHFRELNLPQIKRYLDQEQPYNCAGSFKSEGLGIALFERLEGDDPNALIGLPLIQLVRMLAREGIEIP
ncbi:Maf-like protein YceF [hydrothermal vent metagenome]|uniref:Maf-like protein YceF n=1 Tax=hydrothermal vent metagenome TaxID=652676 RepID=A0A3B1AUQ5_9ZZZZ